jgi:hypothetical protein
MHRVLTASVLSILAIFPLRGWPENTASKTIQVTVFVYNDASVPPAVLQRAEQRAGSIFAHANFDVVWVNCLPPGTEEDAQSCHRIDPPEHFALRIISDATNSTRDAVFGIAFLSPDGSGESSDVFWKRAEDLHATSNLDLGSILGSVMAHEMGHLLLGSHAHAVGGIMRARWEGEELRRIAMGTLLFTPQQADLMRGNASRLEAAEQSVEQKPPSSL